MAYSVAVTGGTDPGLAGEWRESMLRLSRRFREIASGSRDPAGNSTVVTIRNAAVAASATVTLASVSANDTVTINNHAFTAKTSGPTGDQWLVGVTDTADAAALAAAINASATAGIAGIVTATSAATVVTVSAAQGGLIGNAITLASSNGTRLAVSAARLAGGSETALTFNL